MRAAVSAVLLAGAAWLAACSLFTSTNDLSGAGEPGSDAAATSDALASDASPSGEGGTSDGSIGPPSTFASGQSHPTAILSDGTTVFWTNQTTTGALMACAESGCITPQSLVGTQRNPVALAIGGTLFWSTLDDNLVWALVGVDGGFAASKECYGAVATASPTSLAPIPRGVIWVNESSSSVIGCSGDSAFFVADGQPSPHAVATDASRAYWAVQDKIASVALGSTCGSTNGIACDVLASSVHAHAIVPDVLDVYWADDAGGGIYAVAKSGGAPRKIADGQNHPWQLAIDGNDVVWTNFGSGSAADGSVARAPKGGGGPVTVVASALAQPWGIAVGTKQIFWTNSGDGTVGAVPR